MIYFLVKFILTNIIFSLIIAGIFIIFSKKNRNQSIIEILFYSLGLGPGITVIFLYWLIFLFPGQSDNFYFFIIIAAYILFICPVLIYLVRIRKEIALFFKINYRKWKALFNTSIKVNRIFFCLVIVVIIAFPSITEYGHSLLSKEIIGHDALAYATEGKVFYIEKSFKFKYLSYYPKTGFNIFSQHAPGFSLLLTWEKILNSYFSQDTDHYFKSISFYYGILIVIVLFYWLLKINKYLSFVGIIALFSGISFFAKFCSYYATDMYRIYFLSISWIFLAYAVERKNIFSLFMFGLFSGLSAFAHSVGAIISCFNCLVFFLLIDTDIKTRIKYTAYSAALIFIFGGFHYLYDTFWGKGWIFR